jgi:hypothetical protein
VFHLGFIRQIGWHDRDGAHGTVAVPDHGWAVDSGFGKIAVADDGRLVAIGTRVWVVDPAHGTVLDCGAAGDYADPPQLTRVDGRLRLWWTELGSRS